MESYELRAVLHVHTSASDGTGSIEEVINEASAAGVEVLGINDHCTLAARELGHGGWNGSLFVLAGAELEDVNENNHLLVYGVDRLPDSKDPQVQIAAVNSDGGLCIIAHPCERAGKLPGTRSYSWTAGTPSGAAGVEIWNYMSSWKRGLGPVNLLPRIFLPDNWVRDPDAAAIDLWRITGGCAIACPDAHAFTYGRGPLTVRLFPYQMLFRRLITHILLNEKLPDDDAESERRLIQALREGQCFVSNRLHGDASDFRAGINDGQILLQLPGDGEVVVDGGGTRIFRSRLRAGTHILPVPGLTRAVISVIRNGRTWICACIS